MTAVLDHTTTESELVWPAQTNNGTARQAALDIIHSDSYTPTSVVTYRSRNSLLVIVEQLGEAESLRSELPRDDLHITLLVNQLDKTNIELTELEGMDLVYGNLEFFEGHLGEYLVRVREGETVVNLAKTLGHKREDFDLVLDLSAKPVFSAAVPPPGYFCPKDEAELQTALDSLPELVGEFDKPKYFKYDPNICAHVSSRITGCTRCLDACPTVAIKSLAEWIEVDPYLCQGGGVCATACPTGAITYQFPQVSDLLENIRRGLHRYYDDGGEQPWVLLIDDNTGKQMMAAAIDKVPEHMIPVVVEEVGSIGMDSWLSLLCYGAHGICISCPKDLPAQVRSELEHQVNIAITLLQGLGLASDRIQLIDLEEDHEWWQGLCSLPNGQVVAPTGFAAVEEKRTNLRLALDHLYEHAPNSPQTVDLPAGSPFGEIQVDSDKCTLCMACVSVCPAFALADGEDLPMLRFTESSCVQCGICRQACPEDAIDLHPRYHFDSEIRTRQRVLNEERPFLCVRCSKPFTTEKMMQSIRTKLAGHWMYEDPEQRMRLEMCEDCRVEDLFIKGGGMDQYQ